MGALAVVFPLPLVALLSIFGVYYFTFPCFCSISIPSEQMPAEGGDHLCGQLAFPECPPKRKPPSQSDRLKMMRFRFQFPILELAKQRFDGRMEDHFAEGMLFREQQFLDQMAHLAFLESCELVRPKWCANCGAEEEFYEFCNILFAHVKERHAHFSVQNRENRRWSQKVDKMASTALFILGGVAIGSGIGGMVGFGLSIAFQASESTLVGGGAAAAAWTATSKMGSTAAAGGAVAKALGSAGTKLGVKVGATTGGALTSGALSMRERFGRLLCSSDSRKKQKCQLPYGKRDFVSTLGQQVREGAPLGHLFRRGRFSDGERELLVQLRDAETRMLTQEGVAEAAEATDC